jgi:hypothetical protein
MITPTGLLRLLVVASTLSGLTAQANDPISVSGWDLMTSTEAGFLPVDEQRAESVALPLQLTHTATDGSSTATTTYDFALAGDAGAFQLSFDHQRAGGLGDAAHSQGSISFSVSQSVSYRFDGLYGLQSSGIAFLSVVWLEDLTAGGYVFYQFDEFWDSGAPGPTFPLGQSGPYTSELVGQASGTLQAGHAYEMHYDYLLSAVGFDQGESGSGQMSLTFSPEPGAALLLGAGALMALARRRR